MSTMKDVAEELLRRMRGAEDEATPTGREYRCERCGYESFVTARHHARRLCSRTNCGGTEGPIPGRDERGSREA
jgi:DNA-directed RNA polymerase subunit RPC12/RpoP